MSDEIPYGEDGYDVQQAIRRHKNADTKNQNFDTGILVLEIERLTDKLSKVDCESCWQDGYDEATHKKDSIKSL